MEFEKFEPVCTPGANAFGPGHHTLTSQKAITGINRESRRKWVYSSMILTFTVAVSLLSLISGMSSSFIVFVGLLGIVVAPLQVLASFNLYFFHFAFTYPGVGSLSRFLLGLALYALFSMSAATGLTLSAKYLPRKLQTMTTLHGLPVTTTSYWLVSFLPLRLKRAIGFVFTISLECMVIPVHLLLLFLNAQLAYCNEDFDRSKTGLPSTKKNIVVLIHGNGSNASQWIFGRFFMRARNLDENVEVITVNYFTGPSMRAPCPTGATKTVPGCAQIVVQQIKQKMEERGIENPEKIILIGHSLGTLISSHIQENMQDELKVDHAILVSGPLAGSDLFYWVKNTLNDKVGPSACARFARFGTIRDKFCPTHEWHHGLRKQMRESVEKKTSSYYTISGFCDHLVRPHSALPDFLEEENRVELFHVGHFNIMLSSVCWTHILDNVEKNL